MSGLQPAQRAHHGRFGLGVAAAGGEHLRAHSGVAGAAVNVAQNDGRLHRQHGIDGLRLRRHRHVGRDLRRDIYVHVRCRDVDVCRREVVDRLLGRRLVYVLQILHLLFLLFDFDLDDQLVLGFGLAEDEKKKDYKAGDGDGYHRRHETLEVRARLFVFLAVNRLADAGGDGLQPLEETLLLEEAHDFLEPFVVREDFGDYFIFFGHGLLLSINHTLAAPEILKTPY